MTEIKQTNEEQKGYLTAFVNGKTAGKLTYTFVPDKGIIIDHTEVNKIFHRQNVGKKMVLYMVEYARNNHKKIIPLCPFAKTMFENMEEIRDVLYNS